MPQEFEGDLAGAVFWGADLTGAHMRDVNLTGLTVTHAWMVDVDIDALIERVVINGVDVTDYVNERDQWYPLRSMMRPPDPQGMREAWAALEHTWANTIARALVLPEDALHQQVNGEFTFVQTLRHIVFAMDKWFTVPVLGEPFAAMGLPNTGSLSFPWPGLDLELQSSAAEAIAVHADRSRRIRERLAALDPAELIAPFDILENGPHPLRECIYTVFEEAFWHNRYALRDLAQLEAAG